MEIAGRIEIIATVIIVLLPGTYVRFDSLLTGETLLEARRLGDEALVVWGTARRDRYDVGLRDGTVSITGTLWDRLGPALSFGDDAVRFYARVTCACGMLPEGYDGSWQREQPAG